MDAFYLMHGGVIILYEYDELACMHVTHVCGQTDTRMNTWICIRDEIVSIDRYLAAIYYRGTYLL